MSGRTLGLIQCSVSARTNQAALIHVKAAAVSERHRHPTGRPPEDDVLERKNNEDRQRTASAMVVETIERGYVEALRFCDMLEEIADTLPDRVDRFLAVRQLELQYVDENFAMLQRALLFGVAATLLMVGVSLLVSTVEQLRERRRQLAMLVAFGTRRRTLAWSVLWQTALPVALGLLVAAGAGIGLGSLLLALVQVPPVIDAGQLAFIAGTAAAVVLLVTVMALPVLWRLMRPDGLRTE
jgi:hypothetical protein